MPDKLSQTTYIICVLVAGLSVPHVPSVQRCCHACNREVWVTIDLLGETIRDAPGKVKFICMPCAVADVEEKEFCPPSEAHFARLKSLGFTEDELLKAYELNKRIVLREEPLEKGSSDA